MPGIHQQGNALPRPGNCCVHFLRLPVPAAALHVAMEKMVRDCVQYRLGRLRAGGVIEENEVIPQGGKNGANLIYGEGNHGSNNI